MVNVIGAGVSLLMLETCGDKEFWLDLLGAIILVDVFWEIAKNIWIVRTWKKLFIKGVIEMGVLEVFGGI